MLDLVLTESSDRAYVVCDLVKCLNNAKGNCTIHMVKGRRELLATGHCTDYVS